MEYTNEVMDHFLNPRNVGDIEDPDGIGEVGNPRCGDVMKIFIKIDLGIISDIKFKTFGCPAAIASSSMATVLIKNKSIPEALKVTNEDIVQKLGGLPEIKLHCSVLAKEAFKAAVEDYCNKFKIDFKTFIYEPIING